MHLIKFEDNVCPQSRDANCIIMQLTCKMYNYDGNSITDYATLQNALFCDFNSKTKMS